MSGSWDDIAALAIGAAQLDEAAALTGQLAADPGLRAAYRADLEAAGLTGYLAEATSGQFSDVRKDALKSRILSDARKMSQGAPETRNYAWIVPREQLMPFSEGIKWAVLPDENITTIYWVFEPPACGDLPLETHVHKQSGYVLEGAFTLIFENGNQPLKAGDLYSIEPGMLHGATFQARTVLCDVYAPKHAEFEALYRAHAAAKRGQS